MLGWLKPLYEYPVLHWLPHVRFSWGHGGLTGKQYRDGYAHLFPGAILLSTDSMRLSSFLTRGDLDHAALCIAVGDDEEIGEMTAHGYSKCTFYDTCHISDRVVILRCKDWGEEYAKQVVAKCREMEGVPYDVWFMLGGSALYCSELPWACDTLKKLSIKYSYTLGKALVLPMDIYDSGNCEIVWDSDGPIHE